MAAFHVVSLFFITCFLVQQFAYGSIEVRYYSQHLNHFGVEGNKYDNVSFNQKIAIDDENWGGAQKKAPILAFFGGERPIGMDIGQIGVINEAVPHLQALVLYIEHRFYGTSVPYGSVEIALGSSQVRSFLTSEQALVDFANIIVSLKANLSANHSPVVVFGYGYGGVLAAWFRLKYPHIAIGALASSAPILFQQNAPLEEDFCTILSKSFEDVNPVCAHQIRQSWDAIGELTSRVNGLGVLTKTFNLCRPLMSSLELTRLLAHTYAFAAMGNGPDNSLISNICDAIIGTKVSNDIGLKNIAAAVGIIYSDNKAGSCIDLNITGVSLSDDPVYAPWNWQTCTEIIMHKSCAKNNSLHIPSQAVEDGNVHREDCLKKYGTLPPSNRVPHFYTVRDMRVVGSNIIFSNGRMDPYSSLGVLKNISDSVVAITTNEGSQNMDKYIGQENDPEWLKNQREKEIQIIKSWIKSGAAKIPDCSIAIIIHFIVLLLLLHIL